MDGRRHFLRFGLRQVFLLMAALSVLLGLLAPRYAESVRSQRRQLRDDAFLRAVAGRRMPEIVQCLRDGQDLAARDQYGLTAIDYAVNSNDVELARVLIEAGADLYGLYGSPPVPLLVFAIRNNDAALVTTVLERNADANATFGTITQLPIHECIRSGNLDVLQALLRFKANPNLTANTQFPVFIGRGRTASPTALQVVIQSNHATGRKLDMLQMLIEHGADASYRANGMSPMDVAVALSAQDGKSEEASRIGDLLKRNGAAYTVRESAAFGRLDEVRERVQADKSLLSESCAIPSEREGEDGASLLGIALERGHRELACWLIEAGAPLDSVETSGGTLLHQAAKGGDVPLIRHLVDRGLTVDARTTRVENTPLHIAATAGRVEAIQFFLEAGIAVNARNALQQTPLHAAAGNRHVSAEVVRLLLAAGADPAVADVRGESAIDRISRWGDPELLELVTQ